MQNSLYFCINFSKRKRLRTYARSLKIISFYHSHSKSLMILSAAVNHKSAVELFQQHYPCKLVRKCHFRH